MASEEDDVLLFLIYQHLKVNGYQKAAKLLEKHVTQVESPVESSNLHDIYTGWMKLCSLAQHAKQETEESSNSNKSIKVEPATSEEEEAADIRLLSVAGGDDVDFKPPLEPRADAVEPLKAESISESVSEQLLAADNKSQITNSDSESPDFSDSEVEDEKIKVEETKTEQEHTNEPYCCTESLTLHSAEHLIGSERWSPINESSPTEVPAEVSNEAESLSSASVDSEDIIALSPVDPGQPAPDQTEDQPQAPDLAEASISQSDDQEGDNELKQEPQAVTNTSEVIDDASVSQQTDVDQVKAALFPTQEAGKAESTKGEEATAAEMLSLVEPSTSDLTAQETNDQLTDSQAPLTADPDGESENPKEEDENIEETKCEMSEGRDLTPEQEEETEKSKIPVGHEVNGDLSVAQIEEEATLVSEGRSDPDASIIINVIVKDDEAAERETSQLHPEETAVSCKDSSTSKKKKRKRKQDVETPTADTLITDTSSSSNASSLDPLSETPLTRKSAKKKKRDKKRHEEVVEDEVSQVAPPEKKKKAKKRKRERDEAEEKEEETHTVTPSENKIKKKKKAAKNVEEEWSEAGGAVEENPVGPAETTEEKKKKRKKRKMEGGQEKEESQSENQPAGGNNSTEEKMEATEGKSSQLPSAKKKRRPRKNLSLKRRLKRQKMEKTAMRLMKCHKLPAGQNHTRKKKQKQIQEETEEALHQEPTKRPQVDPIQEDETPKKKKKMKIHPEQEEISSKENQPPKTKKEKKRLLQAEDQSSVLNEQSAAILEAETSVLSNGGKKKKKKKAVKGEEATEDSAPITESQDVPAEKTKKSRLKEESEAEPAEDAHTASAVPRKKKKSSKKKIN